MQTPRLMWRTRSCAAAAQPPPLETARSLLLFRTSDGRAQVAVSRTAMTTATATTTALTSTMMMTRAITGANETRRTEVMKHVPDTMRTSVKLAVAETGWRQCQRNVWICQRVRNVQCALSRAVRACMRGSRISVV